MFKSPPQFANDNIVFTETQNKSSKAQMFRDLIKMLPPVNKESMRILFEHLLRWVVFHFLNCLYQEKSIAVGMVRHRNKDVYLSACLPSILMLIVHCQYTFVSQRWMYVLI